MPSVSGAVDTGAPVGAVVAADERSRVLEVVLATSDRALALIDEAGWRWRGGGDPHRLAVGLVCPGCGEQLVIRLEGGVTANDALSCVRSAGHCLHPVDAASAAAAAQPAGVERAV